MKNLPNSSFGKSFFQRTRSQETESAKGATIEGAPESVEILPAQQSKSAPSRSSQVQSVYVGEQDERAILRARIHRELLEKLDLSALESLERSRVVSEVKGVVQEMLLKEALPLNQGERDELVGQVLDEIFGLGPLEPLLKDPDVSDILVNNYKTVYVEVNGKLKKTDVRFQDEKHLRQIIDRIVSAVGRRVDDSSPTVDARLADGSRVNAVIPPIALDGSYLSIRKFKRDALSAEDLVRRGAMTAPMMELLRGVVGARLNILISGGTGSGKTTLLNALSAFIPVDESIVTIEDAAELQLKQPNVRRMETRPANIEGNGQISARHLVITSLRMRPDRIILGEVRGSEAVDMLQAMNTGHDGSLATLHANTPRDALSRLETMYAMANMNIPDKAVRQQISSAIDIVVQVSRLQDGSRRIVSISELVGMEGEIITMQEIFTFERHGVDADGKVLGKLIPTGIRPAFTERLRSYGFELPADMFRQDESSTSRVVAA